MMTNAGSSASGAGGQGGGVVHGLLTPAWLSRLRGQCVVVKVGGSIQDDVQQLALVASDIAVMRSVGAAVVVVHGGGKAISAAMKDAGLQPRFVQGQRFTDEATLKIAERVLAKVVNAELVGLIARAGVGEGSVMGLHSLGTCVLGAVRATKAGSAEDLGFVGVVPKGGVNVAVIRGLTNQGIVPVIAPVAMDLEGDGEGVGRLNVNADLAGGRVAAELRAAKFVMVSDTPGVRTDAKDASSYVKRLSRGDVERLKAAGVIDGGMLPKVQGCAMALEAGVGGVGGGGEGGGGGGGVWIVDGRVAGAALMAAVDHPETPGTRLTA